MKNASLVPLLGSTLLLLLSFLHSFRCILQIYHLLVIFVIENLPSVLHHQNKQLSERKSFSLSVFLIVLPETQASAAHLLSRVGCRCAGTSQPARRSTAEAAAPRRSTGTAAAPDADGEPPTPASRRFTPKEEKILQPSAPMCPALLQNTTDDTRASNRLFSLPLHCLHEECCVHEQNRTTGFLKMHRETNVMHGWEII